MSEKRLKSHIYYSDLYDRFTVEDCRRVEKLWNDKRTEAPEDKEVTLKQMEAIHQFGKEWHLRATAGERYLKRAETIREWMDRDKKSDDLLENAQPPEDIRCLTCRNRVSVIFKDLWSHDGKEERVLFMFDCPNKCLPRRAFFSDGEEWRVKPDLCLKCNAPLRIKSEEDDGTKVVTTHECSKCDFTKTSEYVWSKKEDDFDPDFATDRDRFCMTDEEGKKYQDEKWNMERAGKFMEEWKEEEKRREEKLKENPKGFHLEGAGYTCFICGDHTPQGDNWYDEYGIKCLVCQKAIDEGEIPASLAKDKDSWYTKYDIESRFNVKGPALRSWVKKGIIKPRTISHYGKGVHYEFFLIEDNKDFLPPKKMVESQFASTTNEKGEKTSRSYPWYCFVNPVEHLKGYKIMDHLRVLTPEEVKAREEEEKKKDEARQARFQARREAKAKRKKSK
jgi:hypothetical protein